MIMVLESIANLI